MNQANGKQPKTNKDEEVEVELTNGLSLGNIFDVEVDPTLTVENAMTIIAPVSGRVNQVPTEKENDESTREDEGK